MDFTVAIGIIFLLISFIGIIGNIIVLFVIAVNKQLHDNTNLLIANLALADFLFLTLCPPISAYAYVYGWQFSETLCYITISLQYVTCYVSVWTLGLLAYDRYLSISSPTLVKSLRRRCTVLYACALSWILPFLINLPQMRNVGVLEFEYEGSYGVVCVDSLTIATDSATVTSARIFYWSFNVFAYLLPLSLCIVFYLLLVKKIWKQKNVTSKTSQKMKRHATRMVFAVILTFGICWFPQNLRFFLRGYNYPGMSFWETGNTEILVLMQSAAQIIAYSNSCINPILYGILSERFRTGLSIAVQKVFCFKNKDGRHIHGFTHGFTHSAFSRSVAPPHSTSPSLTKLCTPTADDGIPKLSSSKSNLAIPSTTTTTTVYMDCRTSDSEETQIML